jgi:hypothetical protein
MTDIYAQHTAAFARVSAYVIARNGERVATIAFKFPADGAGRLYAYVHWLGLPMVRGFAGGYGYDKRSAACANASRRLIETIQKLRASDECGDLPRAENAGVLSFLNAIEPDGGPTWESCLREAGFTVWQAV